jgi:hypothetical protein
VAEVEGGQMIVSLWEGQQQYDSWAEATPCPRSIFQEAWKVNKQQDLEARGGRIIDAENDFLSGVL